MCSGLSGCSAQNDFQRLAPYKTVSYQLCMPSGHSSTVIMSNTAAMHDNSQIGVIGTAADTIHDRYSTICTKVLAKQKHEQHIRLRRCLYTSASSAIAAAWI